jgi:REP element-mobilizing transposase RayT
MPNHLHLLLEGENDNSDLKKFIIDYKQHTSYYYKQQNNKKLWQTNYYEHILRTEEQTLKVAYYIFNNPVRKELVDDFLKYKFHGSFEFDISKMTL